MWLAFRKTFSYYKPFHRLTFYSVFSGAVNSRLILAMEKTLHGHVEIFFTGKTPLFAIWNVTTLIKKLFLLLQWSFFFFSLHDHLFFAIIPRPRRGAKDVDIGFLISGSLSLSYWLSIPAQGVCAVTGETQVMLEAVHKREPPTHFSKLPPTHTYTHYRRLAVFSEYQEENKKSTPTKVIKVN